MAEETKCPCPVISGYRILHVIISSILLFVGFIKVLMVPPFQSEDFILIGYVTGTWILVAVVAEVFKYCLNFISKKCGVSEMKICRMELLIGLGGVALCAITPMVLVFIIINQNIIIYIIYTFHFSISTLSFTFLSNLKIRRYDYNQMKKSWGWTCVVLFHGYIIAIFVSLSIGYECKKDNFGAIIAAYSSFGFAGLASILEFVAACALPIKLRSAEEIREIQEKKTEATTTEPTASEEPIVEDNDDESFNDAFMRFSLLVTILLWIFCIFLTIYTGKFGLAVLAGALCLAIVGVLSLWSSTLGSEKKLELWSWKLKIGFSGIAICGFVPRIAIFFVGWNFEIIVPMFLISLLTACSFYYLFVSGYRKVCNLNYNKYCSHITFMVIFQILLWFLAIRIALIHEAGFQRTMIIHTQIGLFFMSLGSLVDLLVVIMRGVYLRDVPEIQEEKVDVEQGVIKTKKRVTIRIFCPVCRKPYSETSTIPRILRECGDTICETCADLKLKKENHITCSVCKIPTIVRGPASTLMKNFAVFDLMDKID